MRRFSRWLLRYYTPRCPQRLNADQIRLASRLADAWLNSDFSIPLPEVLKFRNKLCPHYNDWYHCPEWASGEAEFLYYKCTVCGNRWNPWPTGSRRYITARFAIVQQQVVDWEGRRVGSPEGERKELDIKTLRYVEDYD